MNIPFCRPYLTGRELTYVREAMDRRHLSGDGPFTKKCDAWLEKATGSARALLTHSCTAALELSAILMDDQAGDEVIMPSLRSLQPRTRLSCGAAVPVFVDIRPGYAQPGRNLESKLRLALARAQSRACTTPGLGARWTRSRSSHKGAA